ncbi:MobF family relaxase [uncultured Kordia sp.]|uniref:MobF family relaxase n=1 Tax=uncultured Kordia sp. TaxID=507699 RepID=UPI002612385E|nr:MobF family relaxase [uncultured Kordia sp.]
MIRIFQSKNANQAKKYFQDSLAKADYYIEDVETKGVFNGKIAKRLGLENKPIDKHIFHNLCDNIHPLTGENLTPRNMPDRRIGNDISFHCPKSVSIFLCLCPDENIKQAVDNSVYKTMCEMQENMFVRVRTNGRNEDRRTGEMIWCNFPHWTARAVTGHAPDPHYHIHCVTMNLSFDTQENRYKAAQFYYIRKDMPYYQARFHKRLANKLGALGYDLRKTKHGFEMTVIPSKAIEFFSKRTNLIGQVANDNNITNPKMLDKLGAKTREKKDNSRTISQLQEIWHDELLKENITPSTSEEEPTTDSNLTVEKTIEHAVEHCFAHSSVKRQTQILSQAYQYSIDNSNISLAQIDKALDNRDEIFKVTADHQIYCTTETIKSQEKQIIERAQSTIGTLPALKNRFDVSHLNHLNDEQQKAVRYVMQSRNMVNIINGGAGTGKTTLLKTIVPEIEKQGKEIFLFAPTAEASRNVLKNEGFEQADTLSKLLIDKTIQEKIKGQVVWIDEAGLIGADDMLKLFELAQKLELRLMLSGDTKQHTAVQRGDALRLLQEIGRVPYASVDTIYRQKIAEYKTAIHEISQGNIMLGFEHLDKMGAIHEADYATINQAISDDYLEAKTEKKSMLVITPMREKVKTLNLDIRDVLQVKGYIEKKERSVTVFDNYHYSVAQKQDTRNYYQGLIIQSHFNLKGITKGSVLRVVDIGENEIIGEDNQGTNFTLNLSDAKNFDLYKTRAVKLAKGDEIRINKNGRDLNGKRLDNGTVLNIRGFTSKGVVKAYRNSGKRRVEYLLDKRHGNFDYAYASTSYSAQGKTVDKVIIAQPASAFPASNQNQFYVSVSRGREAVTIYTDDKQELLNAIKQSGDRKGALELVGS